MGYRLMYSLRRFRPRLFGPVLRYDLVRSSRRPRLFVLRSIYAVVLGLMFGWFCLAWSVMAQGSTARHIAELADAFSSVLLLAQFLLVVLLTPLVAASAIAEEKEQRTLEFILATDLSNAEVVLGKLTARVAGLGLLVLTGLPVYFLAFCLGGIDAELVLVGFAITGLTMMSLASLGVLCSVYARRISTAVLMTYLLAGGYILLSLASLLLEDRHVSLWLSKWGINPQPFRELVERVNEVFGAGNIILLVRQPATAWRSGAALTSGMLAPLLRYAIFHLLVTLTCAVWAIARVRAVAKRQSETTAPSLLQLIRRYRQRAAPPSAPPQVGRALQRRAVGRRPVLWKETYADGADGPSGTWFAAALLLVLCAPPTLAIVNYWLDGSNSFDRLREFLNIWTRAFGTSVGCAVALTIAFRSAAAISGERTRQTLDGLLLTTLDRDTILFEKAAGSILRFRRVALSVLLLWVFGAVTGAVQPLAIPLLALAWLIYAAFLSTLGLWYSLVCRTTLRAIAWTMATALALGGGHWLLWIGYWFYFALFGGGSRDNQERLSSIHAAFTPPNVLFLLAFSPEPSGYTTSNDDQQLNTFAWKILVPACLSLLMYLAATAWLGRRAVHRFRAYSGDGAAVETPTAGPAALPRLRRRWRLVLKIGVALALLLGIAVYISQRYGEKKLQEAIAATDGLDPGWRLQELEARRTLIPDEQNAALVVLAAAKEVPLDWPPGKTPVWSIQRFAPGLPPNTVLRLVDGLRPEVPLNAAQAAQVRAALLKVPQALETVARLSNLPRGRFPVDWSTHRFDQLLPHEPEIERVAHLLVLGSILHSQEGRADEALACVHALMNLGRALGDEPSLWSQQTRSELRSRMARSLERVLAQGEPSAAPLEALQHLLEADVTESLVQFALRGERARIHEIMQAQEAGESGLVRSTPGMVLEARVLGAFSTVAGKHAHAEALRLINRLFESGQAANPWDPHSFDNPRYTEFRSSSAVVQHLTRSCIYGLVTFPYNLADLRCALVALACERYRRDQGRWPENLVTLVPQYLNEVPNDPLDGKPLRYRRLPDGAVVYSIGSDKTDSGGKLDRNAPGPWGTINTDRGVQLWDTGRRRQLPGKGGTRKAPQ